MLDAIHFTIIKSPILFTVLESFLILFTAGAMEWIPESDESEIGIAVCMFLFFMSMMIFIPYMWVFYEPSYF
ncbi:hypothetical protein AVU32_gp023 [Vibrio phage ValKK3]|uniref:Uncharacterized protein n=1 Tax=Vibrio phage ValKK3 TaxID=1610855 RepID=A0A0D4DA68_9CAUD|nr:hypothetical protein AVU32_gp023 [Vibrio phage ValKK3]AJT60864.1 hypothetical protein [Vibrio phage ValKK3]